MLKQALARIFLPWRENRRLRRQVEVLNDPQLLELNFQQGLEGWSMDCDVKHWAAKFMAASFAETLGDATNFVVMEIFTEQGPVHVTLQKKWATKTPAIRIGELQAAGQKLLAVCNSIIEDREECGIDESDPDDPLAAIVRAAREAVADAETALSSSRPPKAI